MSKAISAAPRSGPISPTVAAKIRGGSARGPAAIGYIAEAADLTVALMVPAALAVAVAVLGPITMRRLPTGAVPETAEARIPVAAAG